MPPIIRTGSYLLAIAILAFGIEQFIFMHPLTAFIPITPQVQKPVLIAVITGLLFIAAGLRLIFNISGVYTAWFPCTLFFLLCVLLHLPGLVKDIHNGGEWTVCFELIALGSGAMVAVASTCRKYNYQWIFIARILFGVSLIVFSGLHFIYADYIATLIPAWIPFHLFWAYFFGVAFFATALSLLLQLIVRASTVLLATMFFIWVLVLHLPRCLHNPKTEAEWTSLFVALAMGATAILFTGLYNMKDKL